MSDNHGQPRDEVAGDPLHDERLLRVLLVELRQAGGRPLGIGLQDAGKPRHRQCREVGDVPPGERHRQRLAAERSLAVVDGGENLHESAEPPEPSDFDPGNLQK